MARPRWFLVAALTLSACSDGKSYLHVLVDATPPLPVDGVHVTADNGGERSMVLDVRAPSSGFAMSSATPLTFLVVFPESRHGDVTLTIVPFAGARTLGTQTVTATIASGAVVDVPVHFGAPPSDAGLDLRFADGALPDGALPPDLGNLVDGTLVDLAPVVDLMRVPDGALPSDATSLPDLATPPDLVLPPDFAPSPDLWMPDFAPLWPDLAGVPLTLGAANPSRVGDHSSATITLGGTGFLPDLTLTVGGQQVQPIQVTPTSLVFSAPALNQCGPIAISVLSGNQLKTSSALLSYTCSFLSFPSTTVTAVAPTGEAVTALTAGDFDHDGKLDLAGAILYGSAFVNHYPGNGAGQFSTGNNVSVGSAAIPQLAPGDVNGDGTVDLIVPSPSANLIYTLPGGSGFLTNSLTRPTTYTPFGVALDHFSGGAGLDVGMTFSGNANSVFAAVAINNNDGSGGFRSPFFDSMGALPASGLATSGGDVDGDGVPDLAFVNGCFAYVLESKNAGAVATYPSATAPTTMSDSLYSATDVKVVDWDGDGKLDLIVANSDDNASCNGSAAMDNITFFRGDGAGGFAYAGALPVAGFHLRQLAILDANDDGIPDVAVIATGGMALSVVVNRTTSTTLAAGDTYAFAAPAGAVSLQVLAGGDFNGDGLVDLAAGGTGKGTIVTFLNQSH